MTHFDAFTLLEVQHGLVAGMTLLVAILFVHWVADFVLQSDWMAVNKSSNNVALTTHVLFYTTAMTMGFAAIMYLQGRGLFKHNALLVFYVATLVTHWLTDWNTSRLNAYLYDRSRHYFFVAVGFDQWVHVCTLVATVAYTLK